MTAPRTTAGRIERKERLPRTLIATSKFTCKRVVLVPNAGKGQNGNVICSRVLRIEILLLLPLIGCGLVDTATQINEPVPNGTLQAQGSFTSLNGKAVSGVASVYQTSAGNFVLRLEGVSAPTTVSLNVVLAGTFAGRTQNYLQQLLRSGSGTMNYSFSSGTSVAPTWNSVALNSPAENIDYGKVTLIQTSTRTGRSLTERSVQQ